MTSRVLRYNNASRRRIDCIDTGKPTNIQPNPQISIHRRQSCLRWDGQEPPRAANSRKGSICQPRPTPKSARPSRWSRPLTPTFARRSHSSPPSRSDAGWGTIPLLSSGCARPAFSFAGIARMTRLLLQLSRLFRRDGARRPRPSAPSFRRPCHG